jgi:hypothetical protein
MENLEDIEIFNPCEIDDNPEEARKTFQDTLRNEQSQFEFVEETVHSDSIQSRASIDSPISSSENEEVSFESYGREEQGNANISVMSTFPTFALANIRDVEIRSHGIFRVEKVDEEEKIEDRKNVKEESIQRVDLKVSLKSFIKTFRDKLIELERIHREIYKNPKNPPVFLYQLLFYKEKREDLRLVLIRGHYRAIKEAIDDIQTKAFSKINCIDLGNTEQTQRYKKFQK